MENIYTILKKQNLESISELIKSQCHEYSKAICCVTNGRVQK